MEYATGIERRSFKLKLIRVDIMNNNGIDLKSNKFISQQTSCRYWM